MNAQTFQKKIPNKLAGMSNAEVRDAEIEEMEERIILPVITAKFIVDMQDGSMETDCYPFISMTGGSFPYNLERLAYVAIAKKTRLFVGYGNQFWDLAERIARKYYNVEILFGNHAFVATPKSLVEEPAPRVKKQKTVATPNP